MKVAYLKRIFEAVQSIDPQAEIEFYHDDSYDEREDENRPPTMNTFNIKSVKISFYVKEKVSVELIGGSC